jgi:hypothetical protein
VGKIVTPNAYTTALQVDWILGQDEGPADDRAIDAQISGGDHGTM